MLNLGQFYVAISRVTTLPGLHLLDFEEHYIKASSVVEKEMWRLRYGYDWKCPIGIAPTETVPEPLAALFSYIATCLTRHKEYYSSDYEYDCEQLQLFFDQNQQALLYSIEQLSTMEQNFEVNDHISVDGKDLQLGMWKDNNNSIFIRMYGYTTGLCTVRPTSCTFIPKPGVTTYWQKSGL